MVKAKATESDEPQAIPSITFARKFIGKKGLAWRIAYGNLGMLQQEGDKPVQLKRLTDGDAIVHAVDNAIEKRLANGFVEVVEVPAPDVPAEVMLDDRSLAEIHPLRRCPGPKLIQNTTAFAEVRTAVNALADYMNDAVDGAEDDARVAIAEAVSWLRTERAAPVPSRAALGAAAFILAADATVSGGPNATARGLEALVDLVAETANVVTAMQMMIDYLLACEKWPTLPMSDAAVGQSPGGNFATGPRAWRTLRKHLAHAPNADYEAARALAESARASGKRTVTVPLAYVFPDVTQWARDAYLQIPKSSISDQAPERWLLTTTLAKRELFGLTQGFVEVDVMWRGRTEATRALIAKVKRKLFETATPCVREVVASAA